MLEALFDGLKGVREFAEAVAASANEFRKVLEKDGWSETAAEQMAVAQYMTIMQITARGAGHD